MEVPTNLRHAACRSPRLNPHVTPWLTGGIFTATYAGLAVGRVPGLRADRPAIAYVGAAAMLCAGAITLGQAVAPDSIDYQTLFLLLGMMVVVAALRVSGAIDRVAHAALGRVRSPRGLLAAVIGLGGVLSMFLVNDVVCLALTPLVLHLARRLGYDPVPHLIGLATASNVGSVGTITGNPQNMIIGAASGLSYGTFAAHLMPVAALGLVVDFAVVALVYRAALRPAGGAGPGGRADLVPDRPVHRRLQRKSGLVAAVTIVLFFTGLPTAVVATGAAAVLLLGRTKPRRIYDEVEWTLLLMFVGLFVVVHAFQLHVVSLWHVERWRWLTGHPVGLLSVASAGLSNVVSNVPAVLLLEPVMHALPAASQRTGWLALAMSSTFAGNLTVLGSVANLIVVERARREGVTISFWEYCKAGVPVTVLSLGLGVGWLAWTH
jgi:Na+/H+ antiporter NhaD/arsenite permease-like protein